MFPDLCKLHLFKPALIHVYFEHLKLPSDARQKSGMLQSALCAALQISLLGWSGERGIEAACTSALTG